MEKTPPRYVRRGYEVNASSDGCIDAIDSYFHQLWEEQESDSRSTTQRQRLCLGQHFLAAHYLSSSDHHRAKSYLEAATSNLLLKRFPKDLVSLKRAQILSFYMGQHGPFLGLVLQVLPVNQEESYIHGILAFPLLELGRMKEAAAASRKGYEIN